MKHQDIQVGETYLFLSDNPTDADRAGRAFKVAVKVKKFTFRRSSNRRIDWILRDGDGKSATPDQLHPHPVCHSCNRLCEDFRCERCEEVVCEFCAASSSYLRVIESVRCKSCDEDMQSSYANFL